MGSRTKRRRAFTISNNLFGCLARIAMYILAEMIWSRFWIRYLRGCAQLRTAHRWIYLIFPLSVSKEEGRTLNYVGCIVIAIG